MNRRRQVTISCNVVSGMGENTVSAALKKIIADEHLPFGYEAGPAGNTREGRKTAAAFGLAFVASFIFMYLILAAQFESWLHPITILLCLPLSIPFALLSILIFGQQLTVFSALGLLVLFGVVKRIRSCRSITRSTFAPRECHAQTPSSKQTATDFARF
jgi:HAE1 family hydrophobic/amphiphilic exporter-1